MSHLQPISLHRKNNVFVTIASVIMLCMLGLAIAAPAMAEGYSKEEKDFTIEMIAKTLEKFGETKAANDFRQEYKDGYVSFDSITDPTTAPFILYGHNYITLPDKMIISKDRNNHDRTKKNPYATNPGLVGMAETVYHEMIHSAQTNPGSVPEDEDPAWQNTDKALANWTRNTLKEYNRLKNTQPDSEELAEVEGLLQGLKNEATTLKTARDKLLKAGTLSKGHTWEMEDKALVSELNKAASEADRDAKKRTKDQYNKAKKELDKSKAELKQIKTTMGEAEQAAKQAVKAAAETGELSKAISEAAALAEQEKILCAEAERLLSQVKAASADASARLKGMASCFNSAKKMSNKTCQIADQAVQAKPKKTPSELKALLSKAKAAATLSQLAVDDCFNQTFGVESAFSQASSANDNYKNTLARLNALDVSSRVAATSDKLSDLEKSLGDAVTLAKAKQKQASLQAGRAVAAKNRVHAQLENNRSSQASKVRQAADQAAQEAFDLVIRSKENVAKAEAAASKALNRLASLKGSAAKLSSSGAQCNLSITAGDQAVEDARNSRDIAANVMTAGASDLASKAEDCVTRIQNHTDKEPEALTGDCHSDRDCPPGYICIVGECDPGMGTPPPTAQQVGAAAGAGDDVQTPVPETGGASGSVIPQTRPELPAGDPYDEPYYPESRHPPGQGHDRARPPADDFGDQFTNPDRLLPPPPPPPPPGSSYGGGSSGGSSGGGSSTPPSGGGGCGPGCHVRPDGGGCHCGGD